MKLLMTFSLVLLSFSLLPRAQADPARFILDARKEADELIPRSAGHERPQSRWLDDAELRLSLDDDERQGVALRLQPKTRKERAAERAMEQLYSQRLAMDHDVALAEALRRRHLVLLDLATLQFDRGQLERRADVLRASLQAHRGLAGTVDFRPERLQELELAQDSLTTQIELNDLRHVELLQVVGGSSSYAELRGQFADAPGEYVSLREMIEILAGLQAASDSACMGVECRSARLALDFAEERRRRDSGRNSFGVSFLQLGHDRDSGGRSSVEVSVGLRLPFGTNRLSIGRASKLARAHADFRSVTMDQDRRLRRGLAELNWAAVEWDLTVRDLDAIDGRLDSRGSTSSVHLMLLLREEKLRLQGRLAALRTSAMREYIALLHEGGHLLSSPARNWLVHG